MGKEYVGLDQESSLELENLRTALTEILPELGPHWNSQIAVVTQRTTISRLLFLDFLYRKVLDIPGHILEFGVQWGATLGQLVALRAIHEPYNIRRLIFGFDTFEGLLGVTSKDNQTFVDGDYSVSSGYRERLELILASSEKLNPMPKFQKTFLVEGDASITVDTWLDSHPATPAAIVFMDLDIYRPTKDVLTKLRGRLIKGSVVVFDEFNHPMFAGEREAALEIFGASNFKFNSLYANAAFITME